MVLTLRGETPADWVRKDQRTKRLNLGWTFCGFVLTMRSALYEWNKDDKVTVRGSCYSSSAYRRYSARTSFCRPECLTDMIEGSMSVPLQ